MNFKLMSVWMSTYLFITSSLRTHVGMQFFHKNCRFVPPIDFEFVNLDGIEDVDFLGAFSVSYLKRDPTCRRSGSSRRSRGKRNGLARFFSRSTLMSSPFPYPFFPPPFRRSISFLTLLRSSSRGSLWNTLPRSSFTNLSLSLSLSPL